jgi:hypothetical protein
VSAAHYHYLTGRSFFPNLITGPFGHGLHLAFLMAAGISLIGAVCSALRGADTVEQAHQAREEPALAEVGSSFAIED